MAEIVAHIEDARNEGTINVYAVCYMQRKKNENIAIALPENLAYDLRRDFFKNLTDYRDAQEVDFNPTIDGLADDTYEYVPLNNVSEKWNEISELLGNAKNYCGKENRSKVQHSNLMVCALDYNNHRYYLLAQQKNRADKMLQGKAVFMQNQDELVSVSSDEIFIMSCFVGAMIDEYEEKVLIFDKKSFQDFFKYDEYQKEVVGRKITILEQWAFLESTELIRKKIDQKNVYRNLAKIFEDQEYLEQIQNTTPAQLKENLLNRSPDDFTENDFEGDQLIVTSQNLDRVMKMLAKGFKFNFFTNSAEGQ